MEKEIRNLSYSEAKQAAVAYQAVKHALRDVEGAPFAGWLRTGSVGEEFKLDPPVSTKFSNLA